MKMIGLLGGISWVSTGMYYELLNRKTAEILGPGQQAPLVLKSYDHHHLYELHLAGRVDEIASELAKGAQDLESIGAEVIAICANTMHEFYDTVQSAVQVPVLHVADACGAAIVDQGFHKATLLGTKYTMEGDFYRNRLLQGFGVETAIPDEEEREIIEKVIRTELTRNLVTEESREEFLRIIGRHAEAGSQCAILGCTEIGLLVKQDDTPIPLFDTTIIHANALVNWATSAG